MSETNHRDEFRAHQSELRKIINTWKLIPGAPSDEFDTLNLGILSHLYRNSDWEKIQRFIESELVIRYGLYDSEFSVEDLVFEV
jgi:hypothetical protein